MQTTIAGHTVEVNEEGYFTDPAEWTKDQAAEIAKGLGIGQLNDKHWAVIDYLRSEHEAGEAMSIRRVGNSGVVDLKTFYALFPGGPLKNASKIAGLSKPTSCI
jgi:dissimilatory sulfite reductase related protein